MVCNGSSKIQAGITLQARRIVKQARQTDKPGFNLSAAGTQTARLRSMAVEKQYKHFSMIRTFHLADWITLANALCGVGAVFSVMTWLQQGVVAHLLIACALLPLALVFDIADGHVARFRHAQSALGRELDSLADVISFGVAPAAIAYGMGMDGFWDRIALGYFVACGVSRLARYNVTAETLKGDSGKVKYYEGTPIPTSLVLVLVMAIAAWQHAIGPMLWLGSIEIGPGFLHPLVLMFALSGSLMISRTLHIPKP
ncbi:CDP-alcohol phosphatidyltransferase family protein [Silvimonas sp. JCM 19000]